MSLLILKGHKSPKSQDSSDYKEDVFKTICLGN